MCIFMEFEVFLNSKIQKLNCMISGEKRTKLVPLKQRLLYNLEKTRSFIEKRV